MRPFFRDRDFEFETLIALGAAEYGAASAGEVLATIEGVRSGDHAGWVTAWRATGRRLAAEAEDAAARGHRRGPALALLRASLYLAIAQAHADGVDEPGLFAALYEEHRAAWDRVCALWSPRIEPLAIPHEGGTFDGWLFRAAEDGRARRTLIVNNGSDGPVTAAWVQGVAEALARGWNAVTFDGPGQNSTLVRRGIGFRPDWEHVLTPVVDHLATLAEVDAARLAVIGVSQGGYWVPRALAFEHRIAAGVADPGVVDVSAALESHLGHRMRRMLDHGDREAFNRAMAAGARFSAGLRHTMAFRFRPYMLPTPFDVFAAARGYALDPETIGRIRCPLLVTDPDDEAFWPGQSQELFDALTGPKDLVRFTRAEGAAGHCEPAATALRAARIMDWLDERVPA